MFTNKEKTIFNTTETEICNIEISNEEFEEVFEELTRKNKIDYKFQNDLITKDDFLLHIKTEILNYYMYLFKKTDDFVIMKQKRQFLGIWTDNDEQEFQQKMQEYNNLIMEYRKIKEDLLNLTGKNELIEYYNNIVLPILKRT